MPRQTVTMPTFKYGTATRSAFVAIPVALVLLTLALDYRQAGGVHLDACYIRRELEKPPATVIPLRDGPLHNYSVYAMWTSMLLLALLPHRRVRAVFSLTYCALWFHATYVLLAALKAPLYDYNCAGRHPFYPNGISGHYCYFVFVALTAPRYARTRLRINPHARQAVLASAAVLLGLFAVGGSATLYRTFFHGYHSPRQIVLGTAMGMLSHVLLDTVMLREGKELPASISISLMLANSLTCFTLYYSLWPHKMAGAAISGGHVVFHLGLWALMMATAWYDGALSGKVATD